MNHSSPLITRRETLARLSGSALALALPGCSSLGDGGGGASDGETKSVAAIITWYIPGSHADVLIGKILEGWRQDRGPGPRLKLASMYIDQFPKGDLARQFSKKYGVPIFDTIEGANAATELYGRVFKATVHREIYAFTDLPRAMAEMHENVQTGIPVVRVADEMPDSVKGLI